MSLERRIHISSGQTHRGYVLETGRRHIYMSQNLTKYYRQISMGFDNDSFDKNQANIDYEDYRELSEKLDFEEEIIENEDLDEVINQIASVSPSAEAIIRNFNIVDKKDVFEKIDHFNYDPLLFRFLTSKALNESIEGLKTEEGFSGHHWNKDHEDETNKDRELEWLSPSIDGSLLIDGYIAWLMVRGGPYGSFDGSKAEAKEWGRKFETQVIDNNYEDCIVKRFEDKQWSDWFKGVLHWDETLILVNDKEKKIWLFMFTATD